MGLFISLSNSLLWINAVILIICIWMLMNCEIFAKIYNFLLNPLEILAMWVSKNLVYYSNQLLVVFCRYFFKIWKPPFPHVHIKIIPWKLYILNPKNYRVIYPESFRNVCLQTYRNKRIGQRVAYFLRKTWTFRVHNPRNIKIENAKFPCHHFYMN